MELFLGVDEELTKSLWVRIMDRAGSGDVIVMSCRPLEEQRDKALHKQIEAASFSQALVLMGDFNHPDIC